jgi:hypothetical protein
VDGCSLMAKLYARSFNGGIIGPDMNGRIDDAKYNTGLAECHNCIVLPQGPIEARPGTAFVREVADSSSATRLIPFRYSTTQTSALEFSEAKIRFHTYGETLLTPTTGLSAWNSGTAYVPGDLATKGGSTWYCVADSTNHDPETGANQYGATPAVSSSWVVTAPTSLTVPPGYTNVGSSLPLTVGVGDLVYIVSTVTTTSYYGGYFGGVPTPYTLTTNWYTGYTGTSVSAPSGYWYEMGTVYEIPSPWAQGDLMSLTYVQSADVMRLCHPLYPPYELRRNGATNWTVITLPFGSTLSAPTISGLVATAASSPSDTQSYSYVATNVTDDQLDESVASAVSSVSNQLFDTGAFNTISFGSTGRRNVYKLSGGVYGFIGQTTTTTLVDDNIAADTSRAPPENKTPFAADYPGAVGYFEQRGIFGGTVALPQTLRMTKTGAESNLDHSIPIKADDAISVRMSAREASIIRHIVPVGELLLLTDSGEWVVSSTDGGPITPYSISLRPQSYIGASLAQPVIVGTSAIYSAARGGHIRAAGFNFDVNSYVSIDMSLRCTHLFDFKSITDIAYAKGPTPIVWATSSDGFLLGMTYVPEQEVYAWHQHTTTGGAFESICVIGEGDHDILYAIVRRPISDTIPLTSVTSSGTTATVTFSENHLLETGSEITVSGANEADYNGTFAVTVTSATVVTYTLASSTTSPATGTIAVTGARYRRYVERMAERLFSELEDYFGVDCGLTYDGAAATTISGLDHLEGKEVAIMINGAVYPSQTVSGGDVTFVAEDVPTGTWKAHVGLAVDAFAQTLPVAAEIEAYAQSTIKNVESVTLRVVNSGAFFAGPDLAHMYEAKIRTDETYGSAPDLQTGEIEVSVSGSWTDDGSVFIRRQTPTPLTIANMTVKLVFGG